MPEFPESDQLRKFIFDAISIRGEFVHLDQSWKAILERHQYPMALRNVMGELSAAAVLLAATLKLNGSLVLQVVGAGPVKLLVVECNGNLQLRATAKWSGELEGMSFSDMIGNGRFSISLDPKDGTQPYQGIVDAQGDSIAAVLDNYMKMSEQLDTHLILASNGEMAAGMLLQKLPHNRQDEEEADMEGWGEAIMLANTLSAEELLSVPAPTLIRRLYHEHDIRMFESTAVSFYCACSRENVGSMLKMLGESEVNAILEEQDKIEVHCEFCNQQYVFDRIDAKMIFMDPTIHQPGKSMH